MALHDQVSFWSVCFAFDFRALQGTRRGSQFLTAVSHLSDQIMGTSDDVVNSADVVLLISNDLAAATAAASCAAARPRPRARGKPNVTM